MIGTIISFIGGTAIPFVAKILERKTEGKIKAEEIKRTIELASLDNAKEMHISDNEVRKAEIELAKSANEVAAKMGNVKTGVQWIDASISLVRALFGFSAVLVFITSAICLWLAKGIGFLLPQEEFICAFFIVLGFFFGERSIKKAYGGKIK